MLLSKISSPIPLITIIGSGRVGSSIALQIASRDLDDITLIDIIQGLPQGEALDLGQAMVEQGTDVEIRGSNDYKDMSGSDLVIVPAGLARKPGMTRLDLLQKNTVIIRGICEKIVEYAPKSMVLMVTNPLDVMTYVAYTTTRFDRGRVFGMGGMLDLSRFKYALARMLNVSRASIQATVIGEHGENMLPLQRFSSVHGIPVTELLSEAQLQEAVEQTRKIAIEVIALKGATFYAPAHGVTRMVEAVVKDKKAVLPLSTYLDGEYGVKDVCIGVPAVLGRNGVEKIVALKLNESERAGFMKGVQTLKEAIKSISG